MHLAVCSHGQILTLDESTFLLANLSLSLDMLMKYGEGGFKDRLRPIADEVKALVDSVHRGIS